MEPVSAPQNEPELLERARQLSGYTLSQVARKLGVQQPGESVHAKGYAGQLLELALGASAGNLSMPDFPQIGVELKSVPVDLSGKPKESTYVCTVPLLPGPQMQFEHSCVWHKLQRVLWFPILAERGTAVGDRRLGRPNLWAPTAAQVELLAADFDDHMAMIQTGEVARITAHHGEILQIRPKGATSQDRTWSLNNQGKRVKTNPRGFYLRPAFTADILSGSIA
jgi:DNA mismatch repair protein MutH